MTDKSLNTRPITEQLKELEDISQAALHHLQPQFPLARIQLLPDSQADFRAYVFFETGEQVTTSEKDGSRDAIEDAVYVAIGNAGKGKRPDISIVFEYDSEENVKENYQGSYYLRML